MVDIFSVIKNMGKMEAKIKELSLRLEEAKAVGSSGGGMVEVVCNGKKDVLDIRIEEGLEKDPKMLKDLIISAIADAQKKAEALFMDEVKSSITTFNL